MCVAVPGRIVAIGPEGAQVQMGERIRRASTILFPDVQGGEYVLVSGGTIVDRLSEEEAEERLAMFAEIMDVLDQVP